MFEITLDDQALSAQLAGLSARLRHTTPLMQRLAQEMDEATRAQFAAQRAPDGTPWAPLQPATLLAYARRKSGSGGILTKAGTVRKGAQRAMAGKKILIDSGRLSHELGRAVTPTSALLSSVQPYSRAHQFGRPEMALPARPYMGFSEALQARIAEVAQAYLDAAVV